MKPKVMLLGFLAAFLLFLVWTSVFVVPQTHHAVVLRFGQFVEAYSEPGLRFKKTIFENVEFFDKRLLDHNAEAKEVISADQKRLIVDAFVRYRITDPLRFKQTVGTETAMRSRLNSILESSLRQVIGSVSLAEAISDKRVSTMRRIREIVNAQAQGAKLAEDGSLILGEEVKGFGIEVVDVRIVRADLPQINAERVYSRMQSVFDQSSKQFRAKGAEDAQKIRSTADKERTILLAEARKKSEVLRGEGDGEATKIFADAIGNDTEFYQFYRSMQAYRKTISNKDTTMIVSPSGDFLQYLEKGAR